MAGGRLRQPEAVPRCSSIDFALNECPSFTQIGWVGVRGNWEGNPFHVFGTAPLYDLEPTATETVRLAFTVPGVNIPINIPVKVRTESDYGLTLEVTGITQELPLARSRHRSLGLPGRHETTSSAFPAARPETRRVPRRMSPMPRGKCDDSVRTSKNPLLGRPAQAPDRQPDGLHRTGTADRTDGPQLQDPEPATIKKRIRRPPTARQRSSGRSSTSASRPTEADAPSGLNLQLIAKQTLGLTNSPSELRSAFVKFPEGFSVNPDAADGQLSCTDAQANFGTDEAEPLPRQLEDRHDRRGHAGAESPADRLALHRRTEAGQPVPAVHGLRGLRDPREAAPKVDPRPADRAADRLRSKTCRRFRSKSSTCTSSPPTAA